MRNLIFCSFDAQYYKRGNVNMYGLLRGYPLLDSHPASEGTPILLVDSWYKSWNKLHMVGLGLCDLPVTNFSLLNIYVYILIMANLGHILEYGLKIGSSQGNGILWGEKRACLHISSVYASVLNVSYLSYKSTRTWMKKCLLYAWQVNIQDWLIVYVTW